MIRYIRFVKDGKYVYYTERHNRIECDEELADDTIQHFDDLEELVKGVDGYHD